MKIGGRHVVVAEHNAGDNNFGPRMPPLYPTRPDVKFVVFMFFVVGEPRAKPTMSKLSGLN